MPVDAHVVVLAGTGLPRFVAEGRGHRNRLSVDIGHVAAELITGASDNDGRCQQSTSASPTKNRAATRCRSSSVLSRRTSSAYFLGLWQNIRTPSALYSQSGSRCAAGTLSATPPWPTYPDDPDEVAVGATYCC